LGREFIRSIPVEAGVPSPFEILGVDADADETAVVRAYRRRVKEVHPDQGGSASEFQVVREAYEQILAGDADPSSLGDATGGAADIASDPTGPESTVDGTGDRATRASSRVEYVDHTVLDDYGWSVEDDDLFEKAAAADLDAAVYGRMDVEPGESLLDAAEERGFAWPFSCRGGACANCAVLVLEGELLQPVDHILSPDHLDQDIRLSCNGVPLTDELRVVFNVKELPELESLRLPPGPFKLAHGD
jgi:ferredoxin